MKTITILLMVFLLILTACASTKTLYPTQTEQETGRVETRQQSSGTSYEAELEKVKSDTMAKNDKLKELFIPYTFKTGNPGDTVTFGAVYNPLNRVSGTYFIKTIFVEARDKNSNPIETDKAVVAQWIRESQTSDFVANEGDNYYFPITFTIGNEIKSGVKTPSGNYAFEVQIYERKVPSSPGDKIKSLVKTIYLRVE